MEKTTSSVNKITSYTGMYKMKLLSYHIITIEELDTINEGFETKEDT